MQIIISNNILTDRKSHCQELSELLNERGIDNAILMGDLSAKESQSTVERLNQGRIKVLVATGQLIGEGFDCKNLSNLFLATPIKFSGRLLQYLGRVLRPALGKDRARIFDYIDARVPVLKYSARAREAVYHE
jgi:superfamily II DNA or RNA helicase